MNWIGSRAHNQLFCVRTRALYHMQPTFRDFLLVLADMPPSWREEWEAALGEHFLVFDPDSIVALLTPASDAQRKPRLSELQRLKQEQVDAARHAAPPDPKKMAAAAYVGCCVYPFVAPVVLSFFACASVCTCGVHACLACECTWAFSTRGREGTTPSCSTAKPRPHAR